jgi:hypothetical protein
MTESNHGQDGQNQANLNNDALDHQLDAALAKFVRVEPRAGLEERILANLRVEQERPAERWWWRWPAVAALAAMIMLTLSLALRSWKPTQNIAAQYPPVPAQSNKPAGAQIANHGESGSIRPHGLSARRLKPRAFSGPPTVVVNSPKLDEFPSPQPLSEQETILTHYVTNYPEQAALIAQARTEELRRDNAEEMREAASADNETSDSRNK